MPSVLLMDRFKVYAIFRGAPHGIGLGGKVIMHMVDSFEVFQDSNSDPADENLTMPVVDGRL
jgi:hypothetical protein